MSAAVLETNWADSQLPTDPDERAKALRSRVKTHEFLASGGIWQGTVDGKAVYSPPVDVTPGNIQDECPWHPTVPGKTPCAAWEEIKAGNITNEADDLTRIRNMTDEELRERVLEKRAARDEAERLWREQNPELAAKSPKVDLDKKVVVSEFGTKYVLPKSRQGKRSSEDIAQSMISDIPAKRYTPPAAPKKNTEKVDVSGLGPVVPESIEIDGEED